MVRGRAISRPAEDIFENIRKVVDYGYKEVVLTGVNLGTYKYKDYDFEKLVEAILEIPGDFRVRISSIEPDGYSASFFRLFQNPKLAPHMHICLQSGSEEILKKMRRMYTAKEFLQLMEKIRADYPDFNLTTDIIVGFPGETEDHFDETVEMVKKIGFGHIHTFKYSVRKGTRAEKMPDQVDEKTKTVRSEVIRRLAEEAKLHYRKSFIGKQQRVLVEKINRKGFATGYGEHYIPVVIESKGLDKNEFYQVEITGIQKGEDPVLTAKLIT
jgi:threonylcarbamoyladenosine tRNA methylthiotransferase MtaB